MSGSEDRGGDDNSIQIINIGRVGDKSFIEFRKKVCVWGGGGEGEWQQYFDFSYITGSMKNATLKNCILGNFFHSYVSSFVIHRILYWFESFIIRPETEFISQFLVVQISPAKFQSMCFNSLIIILQLH